jgi:CubicO group peptidase (beta-lactamase class C family)
MKTLISKVVTQFGIACAIASIITTTNLYAADKKAQIENLVQKYSDYGQFSGSILVAEKGKIIFKKGYGLANMEWEIANSPTTKFRIGSLTKQFTSMLIMQLVQEDKIKLSAKITEYLPEYRNDTGDKITVHHLLTHTSGIPSYTGLPNFFKDISRIHFSVDDFTEKYCSGDLQFEPGTTFRYNNSGYFLLGNIIEKITGDTYEKALQERIFEPLNMVNSGYDTTESILKNRASGYEKSLDGFSNAAFLDMSLPFAAGSLYSTVEDLYLWDRALYTEKLLNNKYKEIMFTPFLKNYAYGWGLADITIEQNEEADKVASIGHSGGINGFHSLITRLVKDQHVIIQLNNTGGASLSAMRQEITKVLYGKPFEAPKKSIVSALYKSLQQSGVTAITSTYNRLKEISPNEYQFSENQLNNFGYQLLQKTKMIAAVEVMKLNAIEYPESANVHDSLGEVYLANDQKNLALASYERSLELDPKNANAQKLIKQLKK